jgi:hypothetical protein
MSVRLSAPRERRRSGLGTVGCIVWALLALGVYTAYKLAPVPLNAGRIQRNVEYALQNMPPTSTEEDVQLRVVTKGSAGSIQLAKENVSVVKETEPGLRTFNIAIQFPNTVRYLGSDRTIRSIVKVTHVIEVDEVALARQLEYERQRKAREFADEIQATYDECEEEWGKGNCTVTETYGGGSNELVKMY